MTELDPDAPHRQRRALAPDNAKDEERLLARLWRLARAGALLASLGGAFFPADVGPRSKARFQAWMLSCLLQTAWLVQDLRGCNVQEARPSYRFSVLARSSATMLPIIRRP